MLKISLEYVASGKQPDVLSMASVRISNSRRKACVCWQVYLKCIKFCNQQGLSLREHRIEDVANPGNLCALIDFWSHTDNNVFPVIWNTVPEMLDTFLLEFRVNRFRYVVRLSVNQFTWLWTISIFSVLADKTTDISYNWTAFYMC